MNRLAKSISAAGLFLLLWALLSVTADAQLAPGENYVGKCARQPACTLTPTGGLAWANGNQVWIVPLMQGTGSVRIWLRNLNPTSAHTTQTITAFLTDDSNAGSLLNQADRWTPAIVEDNILANAQCAAVAINNPAGAPGAQGKGTCYVSGMFGSQLALRITGAAAAAGVPDTFELGIYQGQGLASGPQPGTDSNSGSTSGTNITQWRGVNLAPSSAGIPPLTVANLGSLDAIPDAFSTLEFVNNNNTQNKSGVLVRQQFFNGSTWDRNRSQSQTNAVSSSTLDSVLPGMQIITVPAGWSATSQGTATQCSASVAASATGKRHFITGCTVCVAAGATAQTPLFANLRDGATGAGTIKWSVALAAITNTPWCGEFQGLSSGIIAGTANTAATCELSAASNATVACTATIQGYDQ